jgi:putative spermidine/putrescine transport system substrate-binding protein
MVTSRRTASLAAATLLLMAVAGWVLPAEARDLTVVGWGGASQTALRKAYFEPFMKETGTKLVEDSWQGGIGVLRTKVKGGNANWDVVHVEIEELLLGCEEGLFEKFDWSSVGGRDKFIDAAAISDCGIGAEVWTVGLGYDGDRLKDGPKSWADFWDVKKFPGKRGMKKGAKYTLEIALMADGVKPQEVYQVLATPQGVERAFRKLDELKPHIIWWSSASQVPDLLASREVIMSVGTGGRLFAANDQDKRNFKLVWDGSIYAVDSWVILKGSPNKQQAAQFIAFASRPETQRVFSSSIPLGPTHKDAPTGLAPSVRVNWPSNPENMKNAIPISAAFWVENSDQLNQRFNAWAAR